MILAAVFSAAALVCYIVLALVTVRQDIRNKTNRAFVLYLAAMISWQFTALMVSLSNDPESALFWYRFMTAGLGGQFILYLFFILVFLGRRNRYLSYVGWLICILLLASSGTNLVIENVFKSEITGLYVPTFGVLVPAVVIGTYPFLGYGVYSLIRAHRKTKSNLERNCVRYPLLGAAAVIIGTLSNFIPPLQAYPVDITAGIINAILIAYAILRYQLLDVVLVIRKGLVYSLLTAATASIYLFVVFLFANVFNIIIGPNTATIVALLAASGVAVALRPVRDKTQQAIDRLFFREKYDSSLMLQRLSRTAASVLDLDRLTSMILGEVTTTMHIERAAFFLKQEKSGEFRLIAHRGLDPNTDLRLREDHPVVHWLSGHEDALTRHDVDVMPQFKALWKREIEDLERIRAEIFIPLKVKDDLVGIFAVGPKLSEETYSQDDQLTLTTLTNQTAVAIEHARLYDTERQRTEELDAFAHTVAHDLQNPLGLVIGFAEALEEDHAAMPDEELSRYLHTIAQSTRKASSIVNDLFLLAEVRKMEVPTMPLDMASVVAEAQQCLVYMIEEYQAKITLPETWPVALGYGPWVEGVWVNYLSNAIKYGGQPPRVELGATTQADGTVRFWVRDNGPGLTPEEQARLFTLFTQLDQDRTKGHGLGLSIVWRIVNKLDGQVGVESEVGRGSVFSFTLPGVGT